MADGGIGSVTYEDRIERRERGWRIAHRTVRGRREFGFEWQTELPGGGDAVSWDVEVDIDLLFIGEDADAEG